MRFLKCGPQRAVNTEHITSLVVGGWADRATIEAEMTHGDNIILAHFPSFAEAEKRLVELVGELEKGDI